MISIVSMLAAVLTVNLPSADRAEVYLDGMSDGNPESTIVSAKVAQQDGLTVLNFCLGDQTNGIVRNFFCNSHDGFYESDVRRFREMTLLHEVDPMAIFLRDSVRTFGPAYLPSRICRAIRDGRSELGTLITRADALYAEGYFGNTEADYDVILDGKVVAGDDKAWKQLVGISLDEGFGSDHAENWLRLQGCNETGTSNLEFPVLVDARSLMVSALICDFCESVPDIYAFRSHVQPGQSRTGFRFLIGERPSRTGSSVPILIHRQLLQDDNYCRGFADLIYEACVRPNGELTEKSCMRRLDRRLAEAKAVCGDEIDPAKIVASFEAVRKRLLERCRKYVSECNLAKLLSVPVPLAVDASGNALPGYGRYRGQVSLQLKEGVGKVYYSDNGCDPRDESGELNPLAKEYTGPFEVNGRCRLRARTLTADGEWSALEMVNLNF